MHKYRLVAKKGEGTFSEVLKAQCIKNGKYVAIKCMKNHFDSLEQVNNLREIQALRRLSPHPNIIKLLEVLYDQPTGRLALVFELMDMNIYELIRGRRHYVSEDRLKRYMYQLVKAMDHMHRNGIFHRDIKPENILIMDDVLKLADFGSCRGIYSKQPYTEYISTRWYRAPECLLTDGYYNYKMDMWGVGCVFFEIVSLFPLFPGQNELDQITKIHNVVGTPPPELLSKMKKRSAHMEFNFPPHEGSGIEKLIPHASPDAIDLINKLLAYNPDDRLSARQALRHPYFRELREAEKKQQALILPELSMPTVPGQSGNTGGTGSTAGGMPRSRDSDRSYRKSEHERMAGDASGAEQGSGLPSIKAQGGGGGGQSSKDDGPLPMLQVTSNRIAQQLQAESSETDHEYESGNLPPLAHGQAGRQVGRKAQAGAAAGSYHGYQGYRGPGQVAQGVAGPPKHTTKNPVGAKAKQAPAHGTVGNLGSVLSGQAAGTMKWKGSNAAKNASTKNLGSQFGVYPQRSVTHMKD